MECCETCYDLRYLIRVQADQGTCWVCLNCLLGMTR